MKSTIIEGIPDSKIERLKKHLLKAEQRGNHLRTNPPYPPFYCPFQNFVEESEAWMGKYYYDPSDYHWWEKLSIETRTAITRHIQQWIKDGKKL